MRKNIILLTAICLIFAFSISLLADETLYGPKDISVKKNKKKKINKASFTATDGQEGTITVTNGIDGKEPANSVTIVLNGKKVVSKKQVNSKTETYSGNITLQAINKLKITVKKKGAAIRVEITGKPISERKIFDKVIGIGDSMLAGVQDATLEEPTQINSYGVRIAGAMGVDFVLPLVSEPGIPERFVRMVNGVIVFPFQTGNGERMNPDEQPDNLAVPGAAAGDVFRTKTSPGGDYDYYTELLGGEKTMLDHAKKLDPTFIIFWIGANDALGMALETDPSLHTPVAEFAVDYETVLKKLKALGAKCVTANIPDVSTVGYLIDPNDFGFPLLPVGHKVAATVLIEFYQNGTIPTFTDDDILTPEELAQMSQTVDQLNAEIKRLTTKYNIPLIDVHAILKDIHENGIVVAGETLTTRLFGGVYSMDGVHPSSTGHAVIANHFIDRINKEFGQNIPKVNVIEVFNDDPNRPSNPLGAPASIKQLDKRIFENLKKMLIKPKHALR